MEYISINIKEEDKPIKCNFENDTCNVLQFQTYDEFILWKISNEQLYLLYGNDSNNTEYNKVFAKCFICKYRKSTYKLIIPNKHKYFVYCNECFLKDTIKHQIGEKIYNKIQNICF